MNADLWNKVYAAIEISGRDFTNYISDLAFSGDIDAVIWLKQHGFPCSETAMENAISGGHPDMIEYLIDHAGFSINTSHLIVMVKYGQKEMFKDSSH
jgi:hypothetical protein